MGITKEQFIKEFKRRLTDEYALDRLHDANRDGRAQKGRVPHSPVGRPSGRPG